MAYIDLSSTTSRVYFQLKDLDSNYNASIRTVDYSIELYSSGVEIDSLNNVPLANRTSSGYQYYFSGLNANTRYRVRAVVKNIASGTVPNVSLSASIYTENKPITKPEPPYFDIPTTYIEQTSARIVYGIPEGATGVDIFYGLYGGTLSYVASGTGSRYDLTGLSPGTRYSVRLKSYNASYDSDYTAIQSFWTDDIPTLPIPNIITINTPSDTSVYASSSIVTNVDYYYFEIWNSSRSSRINYNRTSSSYTTFSGLAKGTTYSVRVKVQKSGFDDSGWSGWANATTPYPIGAWAWSSDVSSGANVMISATEWKNFLNKINEVEQKIKGSQTNFDRTMATGTPISAGIVNNAVVAINSMLSTGTMATVSTGQSLSASFFNGMKDKLNSLI